MRSNHRRRHNLVLAPFLGAVVVASVGNASVGSLFRAPDYYTVAAPARNALAYDWNRDGSPDLLVAGSDSVTVFLNNHEGRFSRLLAFANPRSPREMAVADLNDDGLDDLIVGTLVDGLVRPVLTSPTGHVFGSSVQVGSGISSIVTGDFDEDGDVDVAVSRSIGLVLMLTNDGFGTLTLDQNWNHPIAGDGFHLAAGDMNGDSHQDIIVGIGNRLVAVALLGDGQLGFKQREVQTGGFQGDVLLQYVNQDANLDFVTLLGDEQRLTVMRGEGNGSFTQVDSDLAGVFPNDIESLDFDGDTDLDIAVGGGRPLTVLANDGSGQMSKIAEIPTPSNPGGLASADLDSNGYADLIVCNTSRDTVTVLLNVNGGVTPVLVAVAGHEFADGRLTLTWESYSPGVERATVYRRDSRNWIPQGVVRRDALGRLRWEDADVRAGESYGYRLGIMEGDAEVFAGEISLTIPSGSAWGLVPAGANPSKRGVSLSVSLPDGEPATLSVWDLAGRRIDSRRVEDLGVGSHVVEMGKGMNLAPGIYLARLERGGKAIGCRVALLR